MPGLPSGKFSLSSVLDPGEKERPHQHPREGNSRQQGYHAEAKRWDQGCERRDGAKAQSGWKGRGRSTGPGHSSHHHSRQDPGPTGQHHALLLTAMWRKEHRASETGSQRPIRRPVQSSGRQKMSLVTVGVGRHEDV